MSQEPHPTDPPPTAEPSQSPVSGPAPTFAKRWIRDPLAWIAVTALGAAIAVPVTTIVTKIEQPAKRSVKHAKAKRPPADPFAGGMQATSNFGPARPAFRCAAPNACDGPRYVVFNSYINNPVVNGEQPFLAGKDRALPAEANVTDTVTITPRTREIVLRAYIDNDTFLTLPGRQSSALGTKLRVALPSGPVYLAHPTAYLHARNARPRTIWDAMTLRSSRPFEAVYVPGSTQLTRDRRTTHLPDGIASTPGLELGTWKADFSNSGYVTFRLRVHQLPEPVRDPRATFLAGPGSQSPPPARTGPSREPVFDGASGDRFLCAATRCEGPPFPELNAYKNHPVLGDEADFVRAALTSEYGTRGFSTFRTVASVRPGDALLVRVSIDDGGDPDAIGAPPVAELVARSVRARIYVPSGSGRELAIQTTLDSANTQPVEITDLLPVRSDRPIRLVPDARQVEVVSASKAYTSSRTFFPEPRDPASKGLTVGDVAPSFSHIVYLMFTVKIEAG